MPTIQEINQTLLSASLATLKMTYERLAAAANTDVQTEHLLWRLQFIYLWETNRQHFVIQKLFGM